MLVAYTEPGAVYGGCPGCGGMWLDNDACRKLMDGALSEIAREFARAITVRAAKEAKQNPYRDPVAPATRTCPACSGALAKVKLRSPAVEIDACQAHGAYLDRGEIGAIWMETSIRAAELDMAANEMGREVDRERAAAAFGAALDALAVVRFLR